MASIPSNVIMLPIADSRVGSIVDVGGIAYRVVSARPSARIGYHLAGLVIASQSDVPRIGRPESDRAAVAGAAPVTMSGLVGEITLDDAVAFQQAMAEAAARDTGALERLPDQAATIFLDPAAVQAALQQARGSWVGNAFSEDDLLREGLFAAGRAVGIGSYRSSSSEPMGVTRATRPPSERFSGGDLRYEDRNAIYDLHKALRVALAVYTEEGSIKITIERSSASELIWIIRRGSEPIGQIVLQAGRAAQTVPSPPELSPRRDNSVGERGLDL